MRTVTKKEVQSMMPKVGYRLLEVPSWGLGGGREHHPVPQRCQVVFVNVPNLWYAVRFENGIVEGIKLPKTNPLPWEAIE